MNPNKRIFRTALALVLGLSVSNLALGQRDEDKINQGYYFWDFQYGLGELQALANGSDVGNVKYEYRSAEYSYDFCGGAPFYVNLGVEQYRTLTDSIGSMPDGTPVDLSSRESTYYFLAGGVRIRLANAADLYFELGGRDLMDGDQDALGIESTKERGYAEMGFRARVGPARNLELFTEANFDVLNDSRDEYFGRVSAGFRYHSAAGFVIGLRYSAYNEESHRSLLIPGQTHLIFQEREDLTLSLRFNL